MAELIVETGAGLATANSYCTLAEAEAYHASRPYNTAWSSVTGDAADATKEAALMWATRLIDMNFEWEGERAAAAQALSWPRCDAINWNDPFQSYFSPAELPSFLKPAIAELAMWVLASDRNAENAATGIDEMVLGPLEFKFNSRDQRPVIPVIVQQMLSMFGACVDSMDMQLERA
ncbi:MAG: DnaT-like ssDNA-binding protein [Pseudomonadota bacterium]